MTQTTENVEITVRKRAALPKTWGLEEPSGGKGHFLIWVSGSHKSAERARSHVAGTKNLSGEGRAVNKLLRVEEKGALKKPRSREIDARNVT